MAYIPVTPSANISIMWRLWKEAAAQCDIAQGDGTTRAIIRGEFDEDISIYDGVSYVDTTANITADAWQLLELNEWDWTNKTVDLWLNGTKIKDNGDISFANASLNGQVALNQNINQAGVDAYVDNFIVRNWRATEPAWGSWGNEEAEDITLIIGDLSHADALGTVALTQVHNLAVANLAHANTIDNVVLLHQLVVQALNHSHALDGVSLTRIHNLIVQNLAHVHGIENVILLIPLLLIVEDLIHNCSFENVYLTQTIIEKFADYFYQIMGEKEFLAEDGVYVSEIEIEKTFPAPESEEGIFNFEHLKSIRKEDFGGWFLTPWFDEWFGGEQIFNFEHQGVKKFPPGEESGFEFENLKSKILPAQEGDFEYRRF